MSCRWPLSHAQTKRIGVTSLLRPSSNLEFSPTLACRDPANAPAADGASALAAVVIVSTCSQMNHVGKIGAATPRGIPSLASARYGGVRNERLAAGSRRPCVLEDLLQAHRQARLRNRREGIALSCPTARGRRPRRTVSADRSSRRDRRSRSTGSAAARSWSCEVIRVRDRVAVGSLTFRATLGSTSRMERPATKRR